MQRKRHPASGCNGSGEPLGQDFGLEAGLPICTCRGKWVFTHRFSDWKYRETPNPKSKNPKQKKPSTSRFEFQTREKAQSERTHSHFRIKQIQRKKRSSTFNTSAKKNQHQLDSQYFPIFPMSQPRAFRPFDQQGIAHHQFEDPPGPGSQLRRARGA